jgi:inosose dehydratase
MAGEPLIRFGVQTYSWLMSGRHRDRLGDIIAVAGRAGFDGVEPEVVMLGDLDRPGPLAAALDGARVALAAVCLVCDWREAEETPAERSQADVAIELVRHFPGTLLVLCQMPGADRVRLRARQRGALACVDAVARRARDRGVRCSFHPNSPPGSLFRTADDYAVMIDGLDPDLVGYTADLGHIAAGGMDPLEVVRRYRPRIDHLHFKDRDAGGRWASMGRGTIDFPGVVSFLRETRFHGWIMVEDECPAAERDPDGLAIENARYVREVLR